ncbi:helicase [Candidatus Campbellbacteria bacterium CG22_combo_CG10-13_8_21_14_all_36_13]|uniref:Helicase n=1 Tax=Candidatus Campbellbacteria bacterium CG22_combo_CG10-13_8_21_14_all_36_13 TaxID=1974529 RepID=A0A2H0DYF4_9BACT|nr:MAG: helicase [Candidatus Campbellbacteria bacterium CG22_combo_CG10-13_8_21_14_all_36_13]
MRYLVFDIETKNIFQDVGKNDPSLLDLSVLCTYESETGKYDSFLEDDLDRLWPLIESADAIIGYNSNHFDIPLLNKYYPGDMYRFKSIDLMKTIQDALGRRIGLDAVAQATLGTSKTAHGLQAVEWWKQGEVQKVIDYCIADVKVTKDLYEYMRDKKHIKYRDASGEIMQLEIDTLDWDKLDESSATFTLGF